VLLDEELSQVEYCHAQFSLNLPAPAYVKISASKATRSKLLLISKILQLFAESVIPAGIAGI